MSFPELPTDPPQQLIDLLPYSVKEFISIAGLVATIKLVNQYKGRRVIFNTLAKDKAIVSLIGYQAIQAFKRCYGSELILIPSCQKARSWLKYQPIFDDMYLGLSNAKISQKYDYSERYISRLRKSYAIERVNPLRNKKVA